MAYPVGAEARARDMEKRRQKARAARVDMYRSDLGRMLTAAHQILNDPGVDGPLLLSYLIWPTPAMTDALIAMANQDDREEVAA